MEFGVTSVNVSIFWAGPIAGLNAAALTNSIITQLMLLCSHRLLSRHNLAFLCVENVLILK